ncbi:MAG: NAD(+) diphosphatase [Betaproteobacteria bacterium]|nr:NAD(+) diphosphatase [Betaproteobacteria bacterium]
MFSPAVLAPERCASSDWCFLFQGTDLLICEEEEWARIPRRSEAESLGLTPSCSHYLGQLDQQGCYEGCYAGAVPGKTDLPAPWAWRGLRSLFGRLDDLLFGLAGRATQVVQWDLTHQHCGRCGDVTELGSSERSRTCPSCGLVSYPRLAPAIMALVRRERSLLLARSPHFPEGMFSALAGFVEPGESLEETLHREVREEVGVEIANLRYFGSQSWPFPHSLMIAFVADYLSGDIVPQPGEIEAAEWFGIDRLPRLPHRISIARRLIDANVAEIAAMPVSA